MEINVLALPQLPSMIITLVSVFVLYLILRKFLYTPVTEFLAKRKASIQEDLDGAKLAKKEAIDLKEDYEGKIAKAKEEGQEIIESSRRRGNEIREQIVQEAKEEAESLKVRARKDIEREREKAYEEVKASAGELAVLIASKIMEEKITLENQNHLIDKFIDEVGNSKWQN